MKDEKAGLNEALRKKMGGRTFVKNPIPGTKYTIQFQVPKEVLENQHLQQILL